MDKQQFNKLSVLEQLNYVNGELSKGESLRNISSNLGMSKTTIRDRLSKIGYTFNSDMRQYCKDDTLVIQKHKSITKTLPKTDKQAIKSVGDSNTLELQKYKDDLIQLINNKDDILEMLQYYKRNTNVIELPQLDVTNLPEEMKDSIINKSIKVYSGIYTLFDELCSQYKGIKKQDLISLALLEFYNKYSKK